MPKTASFATVEFPDHIWAMGFHVSPDEKLVVTTGAPAHLLGSVVLRDTNVGTCLRQLPIPEGKSSNTARFTDDGRRIAIPSGKAVLVLDASSLEQQTELKFPGDMVLSLGWSADGSHLAAGAFWGHVALWDISGREPVASIKLDTRILLVVILKEKGSRRIVVGTESELLVWTPATGGTTSLLKLPTAWLSKSPLWNYTVSRDRSTIIAVSNRGDICLIDTADGGCRQLGLGLKKSVASVAVSRNSQMVAVGYEGGHAAMINVPDQRVVFRHREEHMDDVRVAVLDDGARVLCIYDRMDLVIRDFRPNAVERLRSMQPTPDGHVHCVMMSGSDSRMDQRGNFDEPVNRLPTQCGKCGFPNPDFVAQPYFLSKGISQPIDMTLAEAGNFFVRPRLKEVLALTVPGQLSFYETADAKSQQTTPWFLAVPNAVVRVNEVISKVARCDACGEPLSAHPGSEYVDGWTQEGRFPHDVFKSQNWWGARNGSRITFDRFLYFSVRLETLLKRLQFRGLVRSSDCKQKATADDDKWIETQLARIAKTPVTGSKDQPDDESGTRWFDQFLERHAARKPKSIDFSSIEQQHSFTLPASYKRYVAQCRTRSFSNVDGVEGFTARIVLPNQLDFAEYRHSGDEPPDSARGEIDGIGFAETDHGDVFCFDVSGGTQGDFPVYHYNHETDSFEPYAPNFVECVRRFSGLP